MIPEVNFVSPPSVLNGEVRKLIPTAKVLVVGAGGIGCEILKNLTLSGFQDIVVIDLDTIDVSNLNRQFLFRKEHVGKSKAIVARDSILLYNPNINIKAYHDSIASQEYGVNFYKQFNFVMNALDNRQARNHVNRMCLAADIPLIESGTAGYAGQVEFIKKGLTQCYECQLKPPQKTYPGCTIRNTPSEPVHCIVWSKHLFNQLFGEEDADQDVSPDTADPEASGSAAANAANTISSSGIMERTSTRTWAQDCNYDPKKLFNKFFKDDIEYLLSMENLWKTRKPPTPLVWDEAASHEGDLIEEPDEGIRKSDMTVWKLNKCAHIFASTVGLLREQLSTKDFLVWDKDDKPSLDFVTACTNIRAHIFSIQKKCRFEVKSIAGNIIPAIATSNAVIAGLAVLMAFKVLAGDYENCQSVYLRPTSKHSNNILVPERVFIPANPKCYVCSSQPFVKVFVNTEVMLVKEFESEILKKELNMIAPDVVLDGKAFVVISSEEGETEFNNEKSLSEVGIVEGALLKVDDFHQNYQLTIAITHYVAKRKEDPVYIVDISGDGVKPSENDDEEEEDEPAEQNGQDKMQIDEQPDTTEKNDVLEVEDPLEGPSTKKHRRNPSEDEDLVMLDEPLN